MTARAPHHGRRQRHRASIGNYRGALARRIQRRQPDLVRARDKTPRGGAAAHCRQAPPALADVGARSATSRSLIYGRYLEGAQPVGTWTRQAIACRPLEQARWASSTAWHVIADFRPPPEFHCSLRSRAGPKPGRERGQAAFVGSRRTGNGRRSRRGEEQERYVVVDPG